MNSFVQESKPLSEYLFNISFNFTTLRVLSFAHNSQSELRLKTSRISKRWLNVIESSKNEKIRGDVDSRIP